MHHICDVAYLWNSIFSSEFSSHAPASSLHICTFTGNSCRFSVAPQKINESTKKMLYLSLHHLHPFWLLYHIFQGMHFLKHIFRDDFKWMLCKGNAVNFQGMLCKGMHILWYIFRETFEGMLCKGMLWISGTAFPYIAFRTYLHSQYAAFPYIASPGFWGMLCKGMLYIENAYMYGMLYKGMRHIEKECM